MKKSILLILLSVAITASAVTMFVARKSKVPPVSENVNIPYFIDTMMSKERWTVNDYYRQVIAGTKTKEQRLSNLGFSSKSKMPLNDATIRGLYDLLNCYDSLYPNNQFINFKCASNLMKKYELEMGLVSSYIGEVPDFAVDSMENFIPPMVFSRADGSLNWRNMMWEATGTSIHEVATWGAGYGGIDSYISWYPRLAAGQMALSKTEKNLYNYALIDREKRVAPKQYLIIAPKEWFMSDANADGFHGQLKKDPIVLYPVDGGYIIVTAW